MRRPKRKGNLRVHDTLSKKNILSNKKGSNGRPV